MKKDFNKNHPEREDDEVFITNADDELDLLDFEDKKSGYGHVGWKTKRKGTVAYDTKGLPLGNRWPGAFPVFVKQAEIKEAEDGEEMLKQLIP